MTPPARSVLLLGADYYGTLAAARCFGKQGFFVAMADEGKRARALFSRHVAQRLVHPPISRPDELVDWLVAWGTAHPGTLLYPPNDHLAWLFAAQHERLAKAFVTYSPSESSIITLLDKQRLHDVCAEVGIEVPETHALGPSGEANALADRLRYPVLLKPRTQVFLEGGIKGFIVDDRAALASELERFRKLVTFNRVLTDRHPDIRAPMVQEYLTAAETQIFSVSGFMPRGGSIVARAAMKVLQRPRKVGIGLCFEGRELEAALVLKLEALFRRVDYFGAFESEFIVMGDRRLLIDVNPRFYSQMGFDIARGAALPMMVWYAANGDTARLDEELALARAFQSNGREVYSHKTMLDLVLTLQGLSGEMSSDDVRHWRRWYADHRPSAIDAVRDPEDRLPALVDAASWVTHFAKHPRSFVRSFVFNR